MWNFRYLYLVFFLVYFDVCYSQIEINKYRNDFKQAEIIFDRIHEICKLDNGNLCGINLYCPLLLVDRETRFIFSNHSLSFSEDSSLNGLYVGVLPSNYLISNSTIYIDSTLYAIFSFEKDMGIDVLVEIGIHEMFHYWQEKNNWYHASYYNDHVETKWGKVYLTLEMKAIQKAFSTEDNQKKKNAIVEALYFRKQRHVLFSDKIPDEINFEIHEGLPDYVKMMLCLKNDSLIRLQLVHEIKELLNENKFLRTFGYVSGSSYAYLLNNPMLLKEVIINGKDIVEILKTSMNITTIPDSLPSSVLEKYDYEAIVHKEDSIEKDKIAFVERIKKQLRESKKLIIPLEGVNFGFNPYDVYSIDTIGTYYPYISVSGNFGQIYSNMGGIISNDIILFWDDNTQNGKYKISLNNGWSIKKKEGVYFLELESKYE